MCGIDFPKLPSEYIVGHILCLNCYSNIYCCCEECGGEDKSKHLEIINSPSFRHNIFKTKKEFDDFLSNYKQEMIFYQLKLLNEDHCYIKSQTNETIKNYFIVLIDNKRFLEENEILKQLENIRDTFKYYSEIKELI